MGRIKLVSAYRKISLLGDTKGTTLFWKSKPVLSTRSQVLMLRGHETQDRKDSILYLHKIYEMFRGGIKGRKRGKR